MGPLDIVIVNWNSGNQLLDCLISIKLYAGNYINSIIIIDNASTDYSLTGIESLGIPLKIICSTENLGFAKACNLGAAQSSSDYLLFLNPDARLLEGTLEKVYAFMESEAAINIGICGVRLLDETEKVQRYCACFPTWRTWVVHSLGLNALFPKIFPTHFMREFDHLSNRRVDHVIGAFFFVRQKAFQYLGGFDEQFFVYLEDLDFSLRAKQAGWETYYLADAVAFHKGGGTSEQIKATRLFYSLQSRILYAFKHFSPIQAWIVMGFSLIIEPMSRLGRAALHGSRQEIHDTMRGYALLWADLLNILKRTKSLS